MPRVSIIIPAFNPGPFLSEAIASVLGQTYTDWEIILVDDGSDEDLSWVSAQHAFITVIRQSNRGLSAARNVAIAKASGELIAFLDADDVWEVTKLATQVSLLDGTPNAVLCHTQMRFIDARGCLGGLGWGGSYESYWDLLHGCGVCVSSVLIRRDILFAAGLFDPLLKTAQDFDLWLKATRFGPMLAIAEPLVFYRWHSQNLSLNYIHTYRELSAILRRHEVAAKDSNNAAHARRAHEGLVRTRRNAVVQATAMMKCDFNTQTPFVALRHLRAALAISIADTTRWAAGVILSRLRSLHPRPKVETATVDNNDNFAIPPLLHDKD